MSTKWKQTAAGIAVLALMALGPLASHARASDSDEADAGARPEKPKADRAQAEKPQADEAEPDEAEKAPAERSVVGKIIDTKLVEVRGTSTKNLLVLVVSDKTGKRLVADLGPANAVVKSKVKVTRGASIAAKGRMAKVQEHPVLVARKVRSGESTLEIARRAQEKQARASKTPRLPAPERESAGDAGEGEEHAAAPKASVRPKKARAR